MNDPRLLQLHADLQASIAAMQTCADTNKAPTVEQVMFLRGHLIALQSYLSDTGWASDVQTIIATQKSNGGRTNAPGQTR